MNSGNDTASGAQLSQKRLPPPAPGNTSGAATSQRNPNHVAALLQSIANEISQSDQRQGQALSDLRARLDQLTERQDPDDSPAPPASEAKPALEAKSAGNQRRSAIGSAAPLLALPDMRSTNPPGASPLAKRTEKNSPSPSQVEQSAAEASARLDHVYAAVAASYGEVAGRRVARTSKILPANPSPRPLGPVATTMAEQTPDDDAGEFMDLSALAEPQIPPMAGTVPIEAQPLISANTLALPEPAPAQAPTESRPVVAASFEVEQSISDLAQRIAATEEKIDEALRGSKACPTLATVAAQVDELRGELEKLTEEHGRVSIEVGKVSQDIKSISQHAGRIGPMGDTLEHLNEAILALRKDMPGFADAAADRLGTRLGATLGGSSGSGELAERLATVQNLLLAQSHENQEADGRSLGALEAIRELVQNLHNRIDALEASDPSPAAIPPAVPGAISDAGPTAQSFVAADAFATPNAPLDAPDAPPFGPTPAKSREDLIASARRAAAAAAHQTEIAAGDQRAVPAMNPRDLVAKPTETPSLLERLGVRGPIATFAMIAVVFVGLGVIYAKYLHGSAPAIAIEQTALPAMPDDPPDAAPKSKTTAPAGSKDASKPASATSQSPDTATPPQAGKTSSLLQGEQSMPAAEAAEIPQPSTIKQVAMIDPSPAMSGSTTTAETLPAAIAPLSIRTAAIEGDAAAAYTVAERYFAGKGVTRDPVAAEHWFERAATAGSVTAEFRLGVLYEKGDDGMPADQAKAMLWYRKGAEHGNARSMHNLAVLYSGQNGGSPDYALAAQWFEKAASFGLKDSQFNLAVLYQNGLGVMKDPGVAYKWFAIAAAGGDAEAAKQRDVLRKSVPAPSLAGIEAEIKSWHPLAQQHQVEGQAPAGGIAALAPSNPATEVGDVQRMLLKLGYDPGTLDGTLTAQTREAIRAFEQRSGLAADGEITDDLVGKLKALTG